MNAVGPTSPEVFTKLFIGGKWQEPSSAAVITVISPSSEQPVAVIPEGQEADIDAAVKAARLAFDEGPWPRLSPEERAVYLRRIGDEVGKRLDALAVSLTEEVGAPVVPSKIMTDFIPPMWADAASLYERFQFEEKRTWEGGSGLVLKEPVGVVGIIIPWNGPAGTASLKMGPALAAGCTVVLKPAVEGAWGTQILAEAIDAAGLPEGVVSVVPAGREVGEHLVTHPGVDKVTFTGSTAAGRRIMSLCGDRIARVTLELGGKSAGIIADDVPLDEVLPSLSFAGIAHSGQICAALTRILVPRERQQELLDALVPVFASATVGDPHDPGTVLGPLVAERQRDRVEGYIRQGIEEGARLVVGGGRPAGLTRGWYVEPTLFADVTPEMVIAQEEIFGPVVVVMPFDDVDDAIRIANSTQYGLSGAVYARDAKLADRVAREVRTGQISVNSWAMCFTQPFGGYKQSGIGREGNVEGLSSFVETKLIQYAD